MSRRRTDMEGRCDGNVSYSVLDRWNDVMTAINYHKRGAYKENLIKSIKTIIGDNVYLNVYDEGGNTPILLAAKNNLPEAVKLFLSIKGISVGATDNYGNDIKALVENSNWAVEVKSEILGMIDSLNASHVYSGLDYNS